MNRRKFIRIAGGTALIAGLDLTALGRLGRASDHDGAAAGFITPNSDFYVTSYARTPSIQADSWRLRITGMVKNPLELRYDAIRDLPALDETMTLECISNPPGGGSIGTARWTGPALLPLLERARINARATSALMIGGDGYFTGVPIEEIRRGENFLPYLMNGVPLPAAHGYPLRIFIPGKYGMKQPKWITEIRLIAGETTGYWESRGWSKSAWRKVNSGYFAPRRPSGFMGIFDRHARVKAPVDIIGWAIAGPAGIRRVEVSTDDGRSWDEARLLDNRSPYVWTVWKYRFAPARAGDYVIRVRATDGKGITQPASESHRSGGGRSAQPRLAITVTAL